MKCELCEGETIIKSGQTYHYVESGLDNVYLENIEVRVCESCGADAPRIPRILDLHATIGQALTAQTYPLSGAEARFLRKELGMKPKDWAAYLHVDVATLALWENGEQSMGLQTDLLMRLLYLNLSAQRSGRALPEGSVEQLASVLTQRTEGRSLFINPWQPPQYSYRAAAEFAFA